MFQKAKPIFLKGLCCEKNIFARFRSFVYSKRASLKIAGATFYKVLINGEFVHYGPARAPHNHMRIDELDISSYLTLDENEIEIQLVSYNVNSFYAVMHKGFLIAEVFDGEKILCATGFDFSGYRDLSKIQKVMRYSYQRHITEVYDFSGQFLVMEETEEVDISLKPLMREVPFPDYEIKNVKSIHYTGSFKVNPDLPLMKNRYIENISPQLLGFNENELERTPFYDYQRLEFETGGAIQPEDFRKITLTKNSYAVYDMRRNKTGFIKVKINAKEKSRIIISFAEYIKEPFVDYRPQIDDVINVVEYSLDKGEYNLETFEAYGFRYLQATVLEGEAEVCSVAVREYIFPSFRIPEISTENEKLIEIYNAAVETFRQNTVDVYMDCPTRERAGWLCDSYYTSQSEHLFTGKSVVEKVFMENFVLGGNIPNLPEGMLAMAYPGDFFNGLHIPQWSLWYILELEGYLQRNLGANKEYFKGLCYNLIKYFTRFKNEYGLLERLPNWNFVEWSKANSWTQDVNYPTNMLYARALEIIGELYDDAKLKSESEEIRKTVANMSFNGTLFTDNAVRDNDGKLCNTGNISEACQYYALIFRTADIESPKYKRLKEIVFDIFGPNREKYHLTGFDIEPANALMGIYLRMELLLKNGKYDLLLKEIEDYFGNMSALTGTLWEHNRIQGSLNHGFASYAGVAIKKALDKKAETK